MKVVASQMCATFLLEKAYIFREFYDCTNIAATMRHSCIDTAVRETGQQRLSSVVFVYCFAHYSVQRGQVTNHMIQNDVIYPRKSLVDELSKSKQSISNAPSNVG